MNSKIITTASMLESAERLRGDIQERLAGHTTQELKATYHALLSRVVRWCEPVAAAPQPIIEADSGSGRLIQEAAIAYGALSRVVVAISEREPQSVPPYLNDIPPESRSDYEKHLSVLAADFDYTGQSARRAGMPLAAPEDIRAVMF
jgi:hypothetical protein